MVHPSDIELAEFCAGRLAEADGQALERHAESCVDCRARLAALKATWAALEQWRPSTPAADLWPAVARRLERRKLPPPWWRRAPLQLAASVAIAVALGHGAGRLAAPGLSPPTGATAPAEEQLRRYLHLDALGPRLPVGMTSVIAEHLLQNGGDPS